MRDADYINGLWNAGGPFIGAEGKAHTRVTVQMPWDTSDPAVKDGDEDHVIHPTMLNVGARNMGRGLPVRWYQKADNSQTEVEIPNIKMVAIDRSIESDAASCNITLYNQWMYDNGTVPADQVTEGNRSLAGYFTPGRGTYPESQARWGHEANSWEQVLLPNTLMRTYQGYGGHEKTLADCLTDGNLILTGVWLVDEVRVSTNGELDIKCRDMAKLLIDQQLYPPLVPTSRYPLTYYRWITDNFDVQARAVRRSVTSTNTVTTTIGNKRTVFRDSSVDRWYPGFTSTGGKVLHGHKGSDSLDGNTTTYWLGEGNSGPDRAFAVNWIEYDCGEAMNAVYMHPWGGNYEMYVSVMEGGVWQGTGTVPYDPSELYATQVTVDTGADIPYVQKFGVPWETGKVYVLPRAYRADRVRISFRHLTYSGIGPWYYRAGVREFRIRATVAATSTTATSTKTEIVQPFFWAAAGLRDPARPNAEGYITVSHLGQIDAFGDLRRKSLSGGNPATSAEVFWIALTSDGEGYWVFRGDGSVTCYGTAGFYGSPKDLGIGTTGGRHPRGGYWQAICPTSTNLGYWCIAVDGRIRAFGDAVAEGFPSTVPGFTFSTSVFISGANSLVGSNGVLVASTDGTVYALGTATHYGNWTKTTLSPGENGGEALSTVVPNLAGDGYWLMSTKGVVQERGAAAFFGQVATPSGDSYRVYDQLIPYRTDDGYLLFSGFGLVTAFGDAGFYGSPIPGSTGQIRRDGNYLDYADIIRDLALWSGFLLYDETLQGFSETPVYGNIETTGAYAEEQLPDDIFDKRPVIDAMTQIKEVVGYLLFVDDEGGIRFESPNFWSYGNFIQSTGERTDIVPEIDERVNLSDYAASRNDESLRSLIIISSEDPNEAGDSTITTKIVPQTASGLKGLLKPAMWVNGWFQHEEEQKIMAELIAMHIWFAQRLGQVTCVANPAIQINDQVRIYERQTSEVFIHYVRGVNTVHDLDSGRYTMTLTTHWLGTGEDWAITDNPDYVEDDDHFVLSRNVIEWLQGAGYDTGSSTQGLLSNTGTMPNTQIYSDPYGSSGQPGDGSAT